MFNNIWCVLVMNFEYLGGEDNEPRSITKSAAADHKVTQRESILLKEKVYVCHK